MTFWHIGHVWENFLTKFFLALKVLWFLRLCAFVRSTSNYSVPNLKAIDNRYLNFKWIFDINIPKWRENNPTFLTKFFLALKVWWFPRLWAFILHCSNFSVPNLEVVDTSILNGFSISIYQITNLVILAYWPCLRKFF